MRFSRHPSAQDRTQGRPIIASVLIALLVSCSAARPAALAMSAATGCVGSASTSGAYSLKVCISSPANGATLSGNATVTATVTASGSSPGVQRVMFYLDGSYLLTDYQSTYALIMPTAQWVDGTHTIGANAVMRDGFTSQRASTSVTFKNGVTSPPVNKSQFHPTSGKSTVNGSPFVVAAVGDGASGQTNAGNVVNLIVSKNPNLLLYLGDVYERGSVSEFYNWYGTSSTFFSQLRSITNPTVGNHEYLTPKAFGYFNYWNNVPNYYSYNTHGWHFISLNSNGQYSPTGVKSAQYAWLQQDLAALAPQTCTIVYYHHPLFNIGPEGQATGMRAIWQLMAKYHVDIVLNGHDHNYQRWYALDASGNRSAGGIVEFIVGGGGHSLQRITQSDDRVAYKNDSNPTAFGALFLQLNSQSANFSYVNTAGKVLDAGMIPCKPMATADAAPAAPGYLLAVAMEATRVELGWRAAPTSSEVRWYGVFRNGVEIGRLESTPAAQYTFSDRGVSGSASYQYSVYSFDAAGNRVGTVGTLDVTTPNRLAESSTSRIDETVNSAVLAIPAG